MKSKLLSFLFIILLFSCQDMTNPKLLDEFVYLSDIDSTIKIELKYITHDNFVGSPVAGYNKTVCICTKDAAKSISSVQKELQEQGYSLIVFDAYRPQMAVDHFIDWAKNINDTLTKSKFYPNVDKKDLFRLNYIASKSSHSRGSTFDVSIVDIDSALLDMGTPFDYFGPESWPSYNGVTAKQKANRMLLRELMVKHGFSPYNEEWWHFTLKDEPFPDTYFNFLIQ